VQYLNLFWKKYGVLVRFFDMEQKIISQVKKTPYQIRLANRDDLLVLPAVEQAAARQFIEIGLTYLENITLPMDTLIAAQKRGHVWVVTTAAAEIVGFALVSTVRDRLHLEEIDIHPAHARQGLGQALIHAICDWAAAGGIKTISLSTFKDIPWNAPYYERLGFKVIPEGELCEDFVKIRAIEARTGLPADQRVIMCKYL
jgi:GNAT superfamily N-acetyltransferase